MEQYKTAEEVFSKQSGLDNFLQQLDFKLGRLAEIKERLETKVDKIYGSTKVESLDKSGACLSEPIFIPTQDTLGHKLDYLDVLINDINDTIEKLEDFI